MPDRQRGRPQARSRSSSLKSVAPHASGSAATKSHQHVIGMAFEILRRQPWLSPEVLNRVAGIIRKPRYGTDHCQFMEGFESQIAPMPPAEPLCARVGGEAHLDFCDQGGVIVTAVMPHAIDEESR